jgi:hypothetical protein
MKHQIIYKNKYKYSSFPLLKKIEDRILIGFFCCPYPDHMGLFEWRIFESFNQGQTWKWPKNQASYYNWNWPAVSPRQRSDRFAYKLGEWEYTTGSAGFGIPGNSKTKRVEKSKIITIQGSNDNWKTGVYRAYELPFVDIVVTFPRPLETEWLDPIKLIPAYAVLPNGQNRALAWQSSDRGKIWNLYNMFPDECSINEMAFIGANKKILAHLRSDEHPYIMESWSWDGITWTYPTNITNGRNSIVGGPPHLLRLNDGRILLTYGYRETPMGIRAGISDNEGYTWSEEIVLRNDGGYASSLHKQNFWQKWTVWGNDEDKFGMDVGYPVSIQLEDNSILTAYYITNSDQITHIATTKWRI